MGGCITEWRQPLSLMQVKAASLKAVPMEEQQFKQEDKDFGVLSSSKMPPKESYAATLCSAGSEVPTEERMRWSASVTDRKVLECRRSAIPSRSQPAERRPLSTADSCGLLGGGR